MMGFLRELMDLNKINNDLIRCDVKRKRNNDFSLSLFDYTDELSIIDKKGFHNVGITFKDLLDINEKYNLRLKEEEISKVMTSEEPFFNFTLLPIPRRVLYDKICVDLYYLMKKGD